MPGDSLNREVHWGKALHIHDNCIETKHCLGCCGVKIDKKIVLMFSRRSGGQSTREEGQDWLTHSRVTARIRLTTTLLHCSNQRNCRQRHCLGDVALGLIIKWFLVTGLGSIMPRTLPNNYSVLKASTWMSLESLSKPSECLSSVYSSLLIKVILKHSTDLHSAVPVQTQNTASNSLFLFSY